MQHAKQDYVRGLYIQGGLHRATPMPPLYTKGMMLQGAPVATRLLKRRPTPKTSLAEIEERLAQAAKRLAEIAAMVKRK